MLGRALIVLPVALFVAAMVVRTAIVSADAIDNPNRATAAWSGHPSVIFSQGLAEVGQAAAAGRPVDPATIERMTQAARKAPLAPEPFLVRGVDAEVAGNERLAGRAFVEARRRNPRSVAARYFLAGHYLRTGRVQAGLGEVSVLARLVPQSRAQVAPYLAAYAKSEGAVPLVKTMLRDHPDLEPALLDSLATDAGNMDLILALWSGTGSDRDQLWQNRLVNQLIAAGQYDRAYAAYARFNRRPAGGALADLDFGAKDAPPPFGWRLASGAEGIAEPIGGGQLHILYYGRQNLMLASRLLRLQPGRYQLQQRRVGSSQDNGQLSWSIRCQPSKGIIAELPLAETGAAGSFVVSASCPAQQIDLVATAPEFPEQADLTLGPLQLRPEGGR